MRCDKGDEEHSDLALYRIAAMNTQLLSALDEATVAVLATAIERLHTKTQELSLALAKDLKTRRRQDGPQRILQPLKTP